MFSSFPCFFLTKTQMLAIQEAMKRVLELESRVAELEEEHNKKVHILAKLQSPAAQKKSVYWDEETIAEHDKERGTRMKIDEPPTPFARDAPRAEDLFRDEPCKNCRSFTNAEAMEEEEEEVPQPTVKLQSPPPIIAASPPAVVSATEKKEDEKEQPSNVGGRRPFVLAPLNLDLVSEEAQQQAHEKAFEESRAKHYNEMEQLKKWREMKKLGLVEDEGEDEDEE